MTKDQELAALREQNAALLNQNRELQERAVSSFGKLTFKVGQKKGIMVIGLQKWPVTLYAGQMERLLDATPEIKTFIAAHPELARK